MSEQPARDFLARHFRVLASAVNIVDWPAYIRGVADAHDAGDAWLDERALSDMLAKYDWRDRALAAEAELRRIKGEQ